MSEHPETIEPAAAATGDGPPPSETAVSEPPPANPPTSPSSYRSAAIALGGALALVVVLVATAPLWAPLLPWGAAPDESALVDGLDRLAATLQQSRQEIGAATAALAKLDRRTAALEAKAASPGDLGELREQVGRSASAAADLQTRIAAIDKEVRAQAAAAADLAARVDGIEKAARTQVANDANETGLALTLLQIRDAVSAGRPFAPQYQALAALARGRPDIAAAAAPLAEPAQTGVASRMVLIDRLRELKAAIDTAKPPASAAGWADATLARLGQLVTIRRIDRGDAESGPAAAVNAAQLALAGGDLAAAVGALDRLTDAPAEVARPWLRLAKERLAVDAALQRVEALLAASLGGAPGAPSATR
jgi:hypothetical protein